MKKSFLFVCALLMLGSFSAAAQTDRGRVMAGGSMSLHIPTDDGDHIQKSRFNFSPTLGFFVADNLALGFGLPVSISRDHNNGTNYTERSSSVGFAPFGRYYFGSANIKPFLEGRFGFERFKTTAARQADRTDDAIFIGLGAGVAFFLNEHVALEPKVSYDAYSRQNTNSAFNFRVGFQVYF